MVRNAIGVASWGSNRIDIFGLGTDNQMYHKAWDGNEWFPSPTDWEPLGGVFNSPPSVVSWSANRIDIFGLGTDNQLYHKAWDGNEWLPSQTDWEPLGGIFHSAPAAVSWSANRIDIFGLGTDDGMYHKAWDGSQWLPSPTDWESLGGVTRRQIKGINFGGVVPGSFGPDISVDPSFGPPAISFNGGYEIEAVPADAQITARIEGDTTHFAVRDIIVMEWVLEPVDPSELPPGHHGRPPKVKVLEQVAQSDGTTPLSVKKDQFVLVRVKYSALSTEGMFAGVLVIQGDTWETINVPLTLFLADVATTVITSPLTIIQGRQADLPIAIHSLAGPAVDVTYEMSRTQLDTGLSLLPNTFHLEAKENKPALLTFQADPQAPLGSNAVAIDQLAFGRRGFFFNVNVVQQPAGPPEAAGGRFCEFADPPGSPSLGPNAYGLKNGFARKSQLTWSLPNTAGLNGVLSAAAAAAAAAATGQPPPPNMQSELQTAFNLWSAASRNALTFQPGPPGGGDIVVGVQDLGPVSPTTGFITLGRTPADGSNTNFNSNAAAIFVPQAPGRSSFLAVAIHELGHALGLAHNTNPASVMYPIQLPPPALPNETLSLDDVAAIQALYSWAPQFPIPGDFGTQAGPALCGCGGVLVLTWRGIGDDHNIRFSKSVDGKSWSDPQLIAGAATADSPSLAWDGNQVWMVWRGVPADQGPGDQGLYFATWNLVGDWSQVQNIGGFGSNVGPSIGIVLGSPLMVWKGVEGDSGIYAASFTGGTWVQQNQNPIPGVGTSDRPAVAADPVTGMPRLVWKGVGGDFALYTSTRQGATNLQQIGFWQPQQQVAWVIVGDGGLGTVEVGRPGSQFGPGLVTASGRLAMVWRGAGDDEDLWFTQAAPDAGVGGQTIAEWSTQAHVGGFASSRFASASRPAIATFAGRTFLAWRGAGADHRIFITSV
jgi:hypothetical protein